MDIEIDSNPSDTPVEDIDENMGVDTTNVPQVELAQNTKENLESEIKKIQPQVEEIFGPQRLKKFFNKLPQRTFMYVLVGFGIM